MSQFLLAPLHQPAFWPLWLVLLAADAAWMRHGKALLRQDYLWLVPGCGVVTWLLVKALPGGWLGMFQPRLLLPLLLILALLPRFITDFGFNSRWVGAGLYVGVVVLGAQMFTTSGAQALGSVVTLTLFLLLLVPVFWLIMLFLD
ncbi:hypothetical protein [Lacticaseibacillus suihuaensis]